MVSKGSRRLVGCAEKCVFKAGIDPEERLSAEALHTPLLLLVGLYLHGRTHLILLGQAVWDHKYVCAHTYIYIYIHTYMYTDMHI